MLDNARFLAHPMEFLVPCYSRWEVFYYGVGMKIYDRIAGKHNFFPSRYRSPKDSVERWPLLRGDGLKGTIAYADGQFDDARYAVALVQTFTDAGGEAVNHARVVRLQPDAGGKICEAEIEDQLSGARTTVRARIFVNCTGPYSDHIRAMANPELEKRLRLSKGVHILLPLDERISDAMVVPKTDDGRVIFAIPWLGRLLVGTTDDEVTHEDELVVKRSEAEYLLQQLNRYLSRPFAVEDIVAGFAGVRPLVSQGQGAQDQEADSRARSGVGSREWTYQRAGRQVDNVSRDGGGCDQRGAAAAGAAGGRLHDARAPSQRIRRLQCRHIRKRWSASYGVPEATARHLSEKFGTQAAAVLELAKQQPELGRPIVEGYPAIQAEIAYSARNEMAATLGDLLERRTGLQFFSWKTAMAAAPVAAAVMQRELGWDAAQTRRAVDEYVSTLSGWSEKIGLAQDVAKA